MRRGRARPEGPVVHRRHRGGQVVARVDRPPPTTTRPGTRGIDAAMNYRVDTSQSSIEGFRAMGAAPFFNPAQTFFSLSGVRGPKAGRVEASGRRRAAGAAERARPPAPSTPHKDAARAPRRLGDAAARRKCAGAAQRRIARAHRPATEEVHRQLDVPDLLLHVVGVVPLGVEVDGDLLAPHPQRVRVRHDLAQRAPAVVLARDHQDGRRDAVDVRHRVALVIRARGRSIGLPPMMAMSHARSGGAHS